LPLTFSNLFWLLVATLGGVHIVLEFMRIQLLYKARKALKPAPHILQGKCVYQEQYPSSGDPDVLYCKNPHVSSVLSSLTDCGECKRRLLPYDGAKFMDYVLFNDFSLNMLRLILSIVMGLIPIIIGLHKLLDILGG